MTEKFTPFDKALRDKLNDHNVVIGDSVFQQLQFKRAYQQKLNDVQTDVTPVSAFEELQFKRALKHKLDNSTAEVPSGLFKNVEYQKAVQSKINNVVPPVRSILFNRMSDKRAFQNKLKDFESGVSADLFDKIQSVRKDRKPKFTFFYWAAASVAACLLLWVLNSQFQPFNKIKTEANTIANGSNTSLQKDKIIFNNAAKTETDLKSDSENKKNKFADQEKNKFADQEKNEFSNSKNKKNVFSFERKNNLSNTQNKNHAFASDNKVSNSENFYRPRGGRITSGSENKILETQIHKSDIAQSTSRASFKQNIKNSEAPVSSPKIVIENAENIANVVDFSKQPDNIFPKEISTLNNNATRVKGGANNLASTTAEHLNTQLYKKGIKSLKPQSFCGPGDECPTFANARLRNAVRAGLFFEPFMGSGFINRKLTENTGDYTTYRQKRDSIETAQFAVQAGAMLGYQFRNGIHIATGFRYERISEKATYDSLGVGQISYVITTNPNTGTTDTSAKVITDGVFRKTRYNTISSFEIPIRLGYTMVLNRNWAIDLTASAGFNFATLTKQSILNPELALADNTEVSNSYFKNAYGWSAGLSVGVSRALSANTQIIVSAYGNYKTSPVTIKDYVLKQNYSTYGLNLAWRYQF